MAKTKVPTKPEARPVNPTEVAVAYDLFDLPTAFHKAGLAGLVLLLESLKARRVLKDGDVKSQLNPTSATISFTEPLLQKLMDDVYDARVVEVSVRSKWQGAELKREESV